MRALNLRGQPRAAPELAAFCPGRVSHNMTPAGCPSPPEVLVVRDDRVPQPHHLGAALPKRRAGQQRLKDRVEALFHVFKQDGPPEADAVFQGAQEVLGGGSAHLQLRAPLHRLDPAVGLALRCGEGWAGSGTKCLPVLRAVDGPAPQSKRHCWAHTQAPPAGQAARKALPQPAAPWPQPGKPPPAGRSLAASAAPWR